MRILPHPSRKQASGKLRDMILEVPGVPPGLIPAVIQTRITAVLQVLPLVLAFLAFVLTLGGAALGRPAQAEESGTAGRSVHLVRLEGTVDRGMAAFLSRSLAEARDAGADAVILEIDTLGGALDGALAMRDQILKEPRVVSFVSGRAWSAGALIALATETIYMTPGSSMGAAEPRPAQEKIISAFRTEMESTAQARGRDPQVAAAMVDSRVSVNGLTNKGELLTLTAAKAAEIGYAEQARTREEVISKLGLEGARLVELRITRAERIAQFITHPFVAPVLLALGLVGLLTEFFSPGFGLPGALGLTFMGLYFGGHLLAGLSGWEVPLLFLGGVFFLLLEAFTPGLGIPGLVGLTALLASIVLAAGDTAAGLRSLAIAGVLSVVLGFLSLRYLVRSPAWNQLILRSRLTTAEGYLSQPETEDLVGRSGIAVTPLRPAGTVEVEGRRLSVVTEGGYTPAGAGVTVIEVHGGRVVVREAAPAPGAGRDQDASSQ